MSVQLGRHKKCAPPTACLYYLVLLPSPQKQILSVPTALSGYMDSAGPPAEVFIRKATATGTPSNTSVAVAYLGIRNEGPVGSLAEAVVGDDGALLREALHVLRLLGQEALRDEQREVRVLDVVRLDALGNRAKNKRKRR